MDSGQFCFKVGDLSVTVYENKAFMVGVPCVHYTVPISGRLSSYPEVVSFIQGLKSGGELVAIGMQALGEEAQRLQVEAFKEALELAGGWNPQPLVNQKWN